MKRYNFSSSHVYIKQFFIIIAVYNYELRAGKETLEDNYLPGATCASILSAIFDEQNLKPQKVEKH